MVYRPNYICKGEASPTGADPGYNLVRAVGPEDYRAASELGLERFGHVEWLKGETPEDQLAAIKVYVEGVKGDLATSVVKTVPESLHQAAAARTLALGGCILHAEIPTDKFSDFSQTLQAIDQAA